MSGVALAVAGIGAVSQADASSKASYAQRKAQADQQAADQAVRDKLDAQIAAQRPLADAAFLRYQQGMMSQAQAQQAAQNRYAGLQGSIARGQLGDLSKVMGMAQFKPFGIKTGAGSSYFDPTTGGAGYSMDPALAAAQQSLFGKAQEAAGGLSVDPTQFAQDYMAKQQGLLAPQRAAEDAQMRAAQLARGRVGVGVASGAAGAGEGGYVNPEQFAKERARAQADASMSADALSRGQQFNANQANLLSGLMGTALSPEDQAMRSLQAASVMGQQAQQAGLNQANLYAGGMSDYYKSLLGQGQTQAGADVLGANAYQTGLQEAYNREQGFLSGLLGNPLQYQAVNTGQAVIPGSAYMGASLGSGLMNAGMAGINKYFNQNQSPYSFWNNPADTFGSPASSAWGASIGAGGE